MKKIFFGLLLILSLSSVAGTLTCGKAKGGNLAPIGGFDLLCKDSDNNMYDVTVAGLSLGLRGIGGDSALGIWCPGKTDMRGFYTGLRAGVAVGIGADVAAFGSVSEGICLLGGFTTSVGINIDASFLEIEDYNRNSSPFRERY